MSGQFRRNGKIWVRVLADLPITGKPTEVRMGRGKGNPAGWIARVSTGQIPFEMDGVSLSNARQAAILATHKLFTRKEDLNWGLGSRIIRSEISTGCFDLLSHEYKRSFLSSIPAHPSKPLTLARCSSKIEKSHIQLVEQP
ncbi:ribosomal protein L16 [Tanacetum coccineum]